MTATAEQLRSDLLALPEADRLELAHVLFNSVEQPLSDEETAFEAELARRHEEILSGEVKGVPVEEAFRQIDEVLATMRKQ